MFQVCPGRWAKPLMSRQAPKSRGKSGDAEKCHQVTCISLALARHCPSLPVPHFNSHWNSCHLYIRSIAYATQLTHVISHLSHFHPVDLTDLTAPHETDVTAKFSRNLFDFVWTVMDWWTHGLMDLSFSLSSYGMSLGWGQVGWSLWLADTLLSDWRPGRRFQLWSSPFQTSAVECHLLVSKGVTECEWWER